MTKQQFVILFNAWCNGELQSGDSAQFSEAVNSGEYDTWVQELVDSHLEAGTLTGQIQMQNKERVLASLLNELSVKPTTPVRVIHRIHLLKTAWFRVAVAILIILTGVLVYNGFFDTPDTAKEIVKGPSTVPDILPGGNKAVLTLSDGRKIELNNGAEGVINDGGLLIKNNDGQLNYGEAEGATHPAAGAGSDYVQDTRSRQHPSEGGDWRASYNTMSTPRGGQYRLVLPDGSKVWLNAESSITFPTLFGDNTREVKMTGEAYFEIKADKTKPFIVKTSSDEIQVLGTSFNINAYDDAPVKTSLLQGSVKVKTAILKPGQAFINGKIIATDLDQDVAWKNGRFDFSGFDVKQAMNQISRWYDIHVQYVGQVGSVQFAGSIRRTIPLDDLLIGLEGMGGLHFSRIEKTVIVSKKLN